MNDKLISYWKKLLHCEGDCRVACGHCPAELHYICKTAAVACAEPVRVNTTTKYVPCQQCNAGDLNKLYEFIYNRDSQLFFDKDHCNFRLLHNRPVRKNGTFVTQK